MTKIFDRKSPYLASIKERYPLSHPGSEKKTHHVVIDLKGSGIRYQVGDSLAVYPANDPVIVQQLLVLMRCKGDEVVDDKRSGKTWQWEEFLEKRANLNTFSKKFLHTVWDKQHDPEKKTFLEPLLEGENFKSYQAARTIKEVLQENREASFSPQELCSLLMPMMPRFYSIASSMNSVGEEAHLTVALETYHVAGEERFGVCTDYLCHRAPLHERTVPVYIHPHQGFTLPENPRIPIIMVGPGTGIAPFRAFMQEREKAQSTGKNWLFFGEWHRRLHFFYQDYWNALEGKGKLRLDVAFSRDQPQKVYVQDRMLDHSSELFRWLKEGAYFFVCGDEKNMAKGVDATLHHIVQQQGKMSEEKAKQYVKQLRAEKRYLKDVY